MTDLDRVGRETVGLVVTELVRRMHDDFVIGFLFQGRDLGRIVRAERSLAEAHLGGEAPYVGRPLGEVHRPLRINRGQFRRRIAFLRQVLERHGVAPEIAARWIEREERLEPVVTDGTDCVPAPRSETDPGPR